MRTPENKCRDSKYYRAPTYCVFKKKGFNDNKLNDKFRNFNTKRNLLKKQNIRCGAIVFDSTFKYVVCIVNNYIYQKEKKEVLGLPKGHIENNETFYDCAKRELNEETGLQMPKTPSKMVYLRINNTYYYPIIMDKNVYFNPKDKKEILKADWYEISELKNNNMNRDLKMLDKFKNRAKTIAKKNMVSM